MEELEDIWLVGGVRDAVKEAARLRAAKAQGAHIEVLPESETGSTYGIEKEKDMTVERV